MKKLNLSGFAHWIMPALVVAVIGGIGTYLIVGSHADTPTPQSVCGGGYRLVATKDARQNTAKTELFVNTSAKKYCALFYATGTYGISYSRGIEVDLLGTRGPNKNLIVRSGTKSDGKFKYYAGPVYVSYAGISYTGVYAPGSFDENVKGAPGGFPPSAFLTYKP